ncbi:MAG: type II toxin-antitoxin system HicB family antitoxin [Synergistaceae bacterium]|nr:type II toxin-antitoxin system HicB family antitoxin [Synergistaceae bacterium]
MSSTYTAVIHTEDYFFVADCAELGITSQGYSFDEALKNLQEATELYIESGQYVPHGRTLITTYNA